MTTYKVGYFVGSLSATSINRVLSRALIRLAPEDLEFTEIPIGDLPLYSQDFDADYPPEATALKEAIARVGRGAVRHARVQPIDPRAPEERDRLGIRPWGQNSFAHIPAAVIGASRRDRHRRRAAEPARRAELLQCAADDIARRRTSSSRPGLRRGRGGDRTTPLGCSSASSWRSSARI